MLSNKIYMQKNISPAVLKLALSFFDFIISSSPNKKRKIDGFMIEKGKDSISIINIRKMEDDCEMEQNRMKRKETNC